MSGRYFDMTDAIAAMMEGHTTSVTNGSFDYYVMDSGYVLRGMYSCDPEHYEIDRKELETIAQGDWYLID